MKQWIHLTFVLIALLACVNLAMAHGGDYSGPNGSGSGNGFSPTGTGTPGPGPGPGGSSTPGSDNSGGNTGPGPGAGPGGPGPGPGAGPGFPGGPGVTGPQGRKNSDNIGTWAAWWFFNDDRFLNLKAKIRAERTQTMSLDWSMGEDDSDLGINKLSAGKIRKQILPALRLSLKDPFFDTRAAALIALGKCGLPEDLFEIKSLLSDRDKRVRESAALAMGILGNKNAIPILIKIMNNEASVRKSLRDGGEILPRTRAFAALALGLIGRRHDIADTKADQALMALINDKKETKAQIDLAVGPIVALGIMKSKAAVPHLVSLLGDKKRRPQARSYAATSLGKIGDRAALKPLVAALRDKHAAVVESAVIALGQVLHATEKEEVARLRRLVSTNPNQSVKNFAIMALAQIGGEDNRQFLTKSLTRGKSLQRSFSSIALGVLFFNNPQEDFRAVTGKIIHAKFNGTKNPSNLGAHAIAMGLMKYDRAGKDILRVLNKGGQASLRQHLAISLGLLEYRDAILDIRTILKEKGDVDLRRNSAIALGLMGDRGAMRFLTDEIADSRNSLPVLGAVTRGLGFIGDASVVPLLISMVAVDGKSKDNARAFSAVALGLLGDKDSLPFTTAIAENNNYIQRTDAIREVLTIL